MLFACWSNLSIDLSTRSIITSIQSRTSSKSSLLSFLELEPTACPSTLSTPSFPFEPLELKLELELELELLDLVFVFDFLASFLTAFLTSSTTFLTASPTTLPIPPNPVEPPAKAVPLARAFARPPPEVTLPFRKSSSVCLWLKIISPR